MSWHLGQADGNISQGLKPISLRFFERPKAEALGYLEESMGPAFSAGLIEMFFELG